MPSPLVTRWRLDPAITFLNHGSFGACPTEVLEAQSRWRLRMEQEPVRFFTQELEGELDEARRSLGAFLGADPEDLAFVPNATTGVNLVLRSLRLQPGDQLLTTDHAYNACANALRAVADAAGAEVVVASVPYPLSGPAQVLEAVLRQVGPRTRLALLDHVTSPTALVWPIAELVAELARRGVDTLVDGAHAPGMLELELDAIGAAYYTGNCHKWMCAPKGAAFLWVRGDRQADIRPLVVSHGANSTRSDRSRFRLTLDWAGTADPTAFLAVPSAIQVIGALVPGGWPEVRAHNHALACEARRLLGDRLGLPPPCPESMLGAMATLPIADGGAGAPSSSFYADPLQEALRREHGIQVPIVPWPAPPRRLLRISAQLYNATEDYARLADALG